MPRRKLVPIGELCPHCGQTHSKCASHSSKTGAPCGSPHLVGQQVCRYHGGNAPQAKAKAAQRVAAAKVEAEIRGFLAQTETPEPVDHLVALESLLTWKFAEVTSVRAHVHTLQAGELTWGTVERTHAKGEAAGRRRVERAGLNVWLEWLHRAEAQLLAIIALCDRAELTPARKAYLERVGTSVAGVLQVFAASMIALVEKSGQDALVAGLQQAFPDLARRALLTLDAGQQFAGGDQ